MKVSRIVLIFMGLILAACTSESKLKPFTNDGCSLFPDGSLKDRNLWCECCVVHDIAYWQGGTEKQRLAADQALKACVLEKTKNSVFAEMMYQGVRVGGSPVFPNWYRWGYGWDYGIGDRALTKEQQQQLNKRLKQLKIEPERLECPE